MNDITARYDSIKEEKDRKRAEKIHEVMKEMGAETYLVLAETPNGLVEAFYGALPHDYAALLQTGMEIFQARTLGGFKGGVFKEDDEVKLS